MLTSIELIVGRNSCFKPNDCPLALQRYHNVVRNVNVEAMIRVKRIIPITNAIMTNLIGIDKAVIQCSAIVEDLVEDKNVRENLSYDWVNWSFTRCLGLRNT